MNDYCDLEARWKALRASGEIAVREVACVGAPRTLLCVELGDAALPAVALSAAVHGDEPAGAWALLDLAQERMLSENFAYRIWPCLNPSGFALGTRESIDGLDINRTFGRGGLTPEARAVITANRDRKFALSIDLHEDDASDGFYCYEYGIGDIGQAIVRAVREAGFPIAECDAGVLRPNQAQEIDAIGGLSYSLSIVRHAAPRTLTFETPAGRMHEERIAMHRIAVVAALDALSQGLR